MGKLFDQVRAAALAERVIFSVHADDMLREREITAWQVVAGLSAGRLLKERPRDRPNPIIEVEQELIDATRVKVVWAYLAHADVAKVVTVHFFDR